MSIALLQVDGALVVPLQADLRDAEVDGIQTAILERLAASRARSVVFDLSTVDLVDSYFGRMIRDTAAMCRLMGAQTVLVGMRPAVAITLVELGLDLPGIGVELDLGRGIAWLQTQRR